VAPGRLPHGTVLRRCLSPVVVLVAACCVVAGAGGCAWETQTPAVATELDADVAPVIWPGNPRPDWYHILDVLEELRERPPLRPLVVLFAGSSGRECTESDETWAAEVRELGGPAVVARNLSSRNKTFAHDLDLVRLLPRTGAPTLVFIGVNLGRFTQWAYAAGPGPATVPDHVTFAYTQHAYAGRAILSPADKRLRVEEWVAERLSVFDAHVERNTATLAELVRVCLARGYEPVLLELPRDTEATGDLMDEPIARYQRGCTEIAEEYGIPYVDFVDDAGLEPTDFYDPWHLVEPGYVKWQRLLARTAARLLTEGG
jgi:lysophospholipase L1-like esterase